MSIESCILMSMANATGHEASPSASLCSYDVFLSFRGEDTRRNFTDHLYTALIQAGVHAFRDDNDLERGQNIESEITKAMQESRISIVVLSKNYASSRWCLAELVIVMERRRTVGHIVIPVFYDVDPSHVSELSGSFAEAFAVHEKCFKEEMEKLEGWKAALREVADLGGFVLEDRYEAQFIRNIIKDVKTKLNRKVLNVSPYLVGVSFDVVRIHLWLRDEAPNSRIMIIYGAGGIGKTTIAKTVYNMNCDNFEGRSFLANIRETSEQSNGLLQIQRQLLSDILKEQPIKIYNVDEGIIKIKEAICCRKVLIVLDDVDQTDQFNAIIGMQKWLLPGSKIIITTRYASFLTVNYEGSLMLKISELDDDSSIQLFSWHSFGQCHPPEGFEKLSESVVSYCNGLPLALQVLGSSLRGKRKDIWESELRKLEALPNRNIQRILRISYDSLQDDHDKNLFLDIACFFVGNDKDYIIKILDDCGFYTIIGLQNLMDRCLITMDEHNHIMMHPLLRDMGRDIVRQESPEDPGKRSRLWHHKDVFTVLKENTGTEAVKALSFKPVTLESKELVLKTEAFAKMQRLKLLRLYNVKLEGGYEDFPRTLISLSWRGFSLNSIPTNLYLDKLTILDMRYSSLKYLWRKTKSLPNLKILNLSHSYFLVATPNFEGLPNLERLILKNCINITEIDESITVLENIVVLNLRECKTLKQLPKKIASLKSLEELVLSGCLELDELPKEVAEMNLKMLAVDGCSIHQLHSTNGDARMSSLDSLFSSWLSPSRGVKSMNFSFTSLPSSLVSLSLANCNLSNDHILKDLSILPSLQHLNLSGNPFHAIPESINSLTLLHSLILDHCQSLQLLPELPMSLNELNINHCTSLERIANLPNLYRGLILRSSGCEKLVEVEGAFKLQPISEIDMEMMKALGLINLESLESLQAKMVSSFTATSTTASVQVLQECGIFTTYLPGSEIPEWYNFQHPGCSFSFNLHGFEGQKIAGLNLCVVYACDESTSWDSNNVLGTAFALIKNASNGFYWTYSPTFYQIPAQNGCNLWLSHWKYVDQLKDGDEVYVGVRMPLGIHIKRIGVHLVRGSQTQSITCSPRYQILNNADISPFLNNIGYILSYNNYNRDVSQLRWDTHCNSLRSTSPQLMSIVNVLNKICKFLSDRM
ncbi:disease resistance protein RPV1-like [Mercurialis annua]|uniref:disease resistance protein RPV1-like n=1 Tax=Mercurialis annua TaxID=3986 RepID=UPI002160BDFC|nr:disease resistance protein RPV1-like [Mercurialis annua]